MDPVLASEREVIVININLTPAKRLQHSNPVLPCRLLVDI